MDRLSNMGHPISFKLSTRNGGIFPETVSEQNNNVIRKITVQDSSKSAAGVVRNIGMSF